MTGTLSIKNAKRQPRSFPLGGLPKADITYVREATVRIRERLHRQRSDILETGADLLKVKDRLDHGQFERWLDHEFTLSLRSAQAFMAAARWVASLPAVKNATIAFFPPTSLYLLSAPSTPAAVRERVIEEAEKTGRAEPKRIRELIQEAKAKPAPEPRKKRWPTRTVHAREREHNKFEEARQRREQANIALAKQLAEVLVRRLDDDEMGLVLDAMTNWAGRKVLREEIDKAQAALPPPSSRPQAIANGAP